jgi:hypothetical protein
MRKLLRQKVVSYFAEMLVDYYLHLYYDFLLNAPFEM